MTYMRQCFTKTEDQCSSQEKAPKEAFENNIHHYDTMRIISKTYLNDRKSSVQEASYHISSKLKLRRIFPSVYFVNTNLSMERLQVLLPEKKNLANYQTIAQIFLKHQV